MKTLETTQNIEQAIGMLLEFKRTVSHGRDTDGYNICTLWDAKTGKRLASCKGGGYDMEGTSFGDWIDTRFQAELLDLANREPVDKYNKDTSNWERVPTDNKYRGSGSEFYGLAAYTKGGEIVKVTLDGACGFESIRRIFNALGLEVKYLRSTKSTKLYEVTQFGSKSSSS
jgi:hypothetical protein